MPYREMPHRGDNAQDSAFMGIMEELDAALVDFYREFHRWEECEHWPIDFRLTAYLNTLAMHYAEVCMRMWDAHDNGNPQWRHVPFDACFDSKQAIYAHFRGTIDLHCRNHARMLVDKYTKPEKE